MFAVQKQVGRYCLKSALAFFIYCIASIICITATEESRGFDVESWNRKVYGTFYDNMYTNLNEAYLLGLTAELTNPIRYFGGGTKSFATQTSVLVPVNVTNHVKLFNMCSEAPKDMASAWRTFLENSSLSSNLLDIHQSISLVLFRSLTNSELDTRYDLNCLINAIQSYDASEHPNLPSIDVIIANGRDVARKALLNVSIPQYDSWIYSNLTTLVYASASSQWDDVLEKAHFNEKRWRNNYTFPVYAIEVRNQMHLLSTHDSCLSSSRWACQPLGGWSVWATTGDSSWSWSSTHHSFERKTTKGAIALMAPLTTASSGRLPAPGADSPASGITAALAIAEAIKQQARNIEVVTFFFVGEYSGGIGSARFMQDASSALACEAFGMEACLKLAYKSNLNFTSVNFSNFDTVVALDQLSYSNSKLYFHVDQRIDQATNIALQSADKLLRDMEVQKAKTNYLYASPATTYVDFLEANNLLSGLNKTVVTLSRYDQFYNNPHVFTPSDVASTNRQLSVESIIEASNAVLRMILGSDVGVKVDRDLVQNLWHCFSVNFSCDFLNIAPNLSSSTPDYTTDVFEVPHSDPTVVVGAAFSKIGMRPAYTAAISPQLQVGEKWGFPWELSERAGQFNSSRYTLLVGSLWNRGNGARTVMLTTTSIGTFLFFVASSLCVILFFTVF